MQHCQEQVAEVCVTVDRPAADFVVSTGIGHVVLTDDRQVKVEVLTVLPPELAAAGKDGGKVGVPMTVPIGHAAAPEHLRGIQQSSVFLLVGFQLVEEVTQLLDEKRVRLR